MRLREHVLDLLAGPYIPFRHSVIEHFLFPFGPVLALALRNRSFSDIFHDRKGKRTFKTHIDKVCHDIISRAYGSRYRGFAFFNDSLCIAEPDIGSVRQTRYPDKIGKRRRFRIKKHLYYEVGTELRYAETPKLASAYILRFDTECFR